MREGREEGVRGRGVRKGSEDGGEEGGGRNVRRKRREQWEVRKVREEAAWGRCVRGHEEGP